MLEAFLLPIVQNVISKYISDVLINRRDAKTRSEVIETVRSQLSSLGEMRGQIDALTMAVNELDFLVRNTTSLHWQGQFLAVTVPPGIAGDPRYAVNDVLAHLRSTVDQRRSELREGQLLMMFASLQQLIGVQDAIVAKMRIAPSLREKWMAQVSVYGMTASYQCAAELYMSVDWNRAYQHVVSGQGPYIPGGRQGAMLVDMSVITHRFVDYVSRNNLSVVLDVKYVPGVDRESANRRLGLSSVGILRWVGREPRAQILRIPELDELAVGLRLT
jgi:hypothetical protein